MKRYKLMWYLTVLSLILAVISPVGNQPTIAIASEDPSQEELLTFVDPAGLYSIQYPSDWQYEKLGDVYIFQAPSADATGMRPVLGVGLVDAKGITIEGLAWSIREGPLHREYLASTDKYQMVAISLERIGDIRAVKHVYTRQPSNLPLQKVIKYTTVRAGQVITLDCRAAAYIFDDYQATFERMASTFKMLGLAEQETGRYTDSRGHFSIEYPVGWQPLTPPGGPLIIYGFMMQGAAPIALSVIPSRAPSPQLNVDSLILDLRQGQTFKDLTGRLVDYKQVSVAATTIGQLPAVKHMYTSTISGNPSKAVQYFVQIGNTFFTVTGSCPPSEFDDNAPTFEWMVTTLELLN